MTDKSFGDHASRNTLKNPLLSTAVTGLSYEDLTHNAVLLPVARSQELFSPRDQGAQTRTLATPNQNIPNFPTGVANSNFPTQNLPPTITPNNLNTNQNEKQHKNIEKPPSTVSKALPKSEDDFDVNEYFARLQGTRYVSAPINLSKEDNNANLQTEENLEEINLNEPEKCDNTEVQHSLTADIAQNFSQLPTVLPQVASAVFSSFSNMLSMKSREHTPDDKVNTVAGYQEVQYRPPEIGVPLMGVEEVKEVAPPPKEPPLVGTSNYRITTKKKAYAQIPGLSYRDVQNISNPSQVMPPIQNFPPYFTPTDQIIQRKEDTQSNVYVFSAIDSQVANNNQLEVDDDTQNPKTDTGHDQNLTQPNADDDEPKLYKNVVQHLVETHGDQKITLGNIAAEIYGQILSQYNPPIIPPPAMFSNQRRDSQGAIGKTILPPSVARHIAAQPKQQAPMPNIFVPVMPEATESTPLDNFHNPHNSASTQIGSNMFTSSVPLAATTNVSSSPSYETNVLGTPILNQITPLPPPPKTVRPPSGSTNVSSETSSLNQISTRPPGSSASLNMLANSINIFTPVAQTTLPATQPTDIAVASVTSSIKPILPPTDSQILSSFETDVTMESRSNLKNVQVPSFAVPSSVTLTFDSQIVPSSTTSSTAANTSGTSPSLQTTLPPPPNIFNPTITDSTLTSSDIPQSQMAIAPPTSMTSPPSSTLNASSAIPIVPIAQPTSLPPKSIFMSPEARSSESVSIFQPNVTPDFSTSSQVNLPPPTFFNPAIQKPEIKTPEIEQPKVPEPPKMSANQNYRMTKKRPQYYSGPIEGVGAISNNIKPVIPVATSSGFHGAMFIPQQVAVDQELVATEQALPSFPASVPNTGQATVPFESDNAIALDNSPNEVYPGTSYNTAFDLSRQTTETYEPKESKGFGIIGSLKSKLSSIDINKIQNSVTTFFDPAYNNTQADYQAPSTSNDNLGIMIDQQQPNQNEQPLPYQNYNYQLPNLPAYNFAPNQEFNYQGHYPDTYTDYNQNSTPINYRGGISLDVTQPYPATVNMGRINTSSVTHGTAVNEVITEHQENALSAEDIRRDYQPVSANDQINTGLLPSVEARLHVGLPNVNEQGSSHQVGYEPAALHSDSYFSDSHIPVAQEPKAAVIDSFFSTSHSQIGIQEPIKDSFFSKSFDSENSSDAAELIEKTEEIERNITNLILSDEDTNPGKDKSEEPNLVLDKATDPFAMSFGVDDNRNSIYSLSNYTESFEQLPAQRLENAFSNFTFDTENKDKELYQMMQEGDEMPTFIDTYGTDESIFDTVNEPTDLSRDIIKMEDTVKRVSLYQLSKNVESLFESEPSIILKLHEMEMRLLEEREKAPDLNICETCREVKNDDDEEEDNNAEDLTSQLIENIIAPIQLHNPVEVPLTESNTPVDDRIDFDDEQCAEITHITEETIETIQGQSATKLLDDNTEQMTYGWRKDSLLPTDDFSFSDTKTLEFYEDNLFFEIPKNASDEIKAEFKSSQEDHPVPTKQMSIPTAPPVSHDDSKSDETGVLDVQSIEMDAKKDFPLFEEFVIDPSETDDDKIEFKERRSTDDTTEDTFTNRIEKFKHMDDDHNDLLSMNPCISIASYFDTGNYAAETHYKKSPFNLVMLPTNIPMRIPPGFEDEYQRKMSGISNESEPYIPDTSTQTPSTTTTTYATSNMRTVTRIAYSKIDEKLPPLPKLFGLQEDIEIAPVVTSIEVYNTAALFGLPDMVTRPVVISADVQDTSSIFGVRTDNTPKAVFNSGEVTESPPSIFGLTRITPRSEITGGELKESPPSISGLSGIIHRPEISSEKVKEPPPSGFDLTGILKHEIVSGQETNSSSVFGRRDIPPKPITSGEVNKPPSSVLGLAGFKSRPEITSGQEMNTSSVFGLTDIPSKPITTGEVNKTPSSVFGLAGLKSRPDITSDEAKNTSSIFGLTDIPPKPIISEINKPPPSVFDLTGMITRPVVTSAEVKNTTSIFGLTDSSKPITNVEVKKHGIFGLESGDASSQIPEKPPLPDPLSFFSTEEPKPENSSNRLASYFTTPTKTDPAKSFFELSQSQNHYRHASNNYNIPLDLMNDLTSTQNLKLKDQVVRHVNYFTIVYDNDVSINNIKNNEPIYKESLAENNEKELEEDKDHVIVKNCIYCCNAIGGFNKGFKYKTAMNAESEKREVVGEVKKKERGASKEVRVDLEENKQEGELSVMAESRATPEYIPVKHHWFYRVDCENKSFWKGFSVLDSNALEEAYLSPNLNENTLVPTDGGRYDVNVVGRLRVAVYWADKPTNVRRCSWFYKGNIDARYVPYSEAIAEKLEEEYRHGITTGIWHRRLFMPNNEMVMMHGPAVMVHMLQSTTTDAFGSTPLFSFTKRVYRNPPKMKVTLDQPPKIDHLVLLVHGAGEYRQQRQKLQSLMRPRMVRRGWDESEIEDTEPSSIDHLLLLCHGVGSACDMRFRSVEEVVDDFRATSLQLLQSHYRNSYDNGLVNRVEILPISWHSTLHSGETGVDRRLSQITLESIPRLRSFTNDTVLDVLFYTSPVFCQTIIDTVCAELNRIYALFMSRNPHFRGKVSIGGHSLGSVILYDLLCHQPHPSATVDKQYVTGNAGTGQSTVQYPKLNFIPAAMYALGSPIAMFECIRGVECLGGDFALPTCKNFFNIFHPYDPIAYRIEPLINAEMRDVKPFLIPHHKGRKRMHLELKDTMARVGADIKQKLLESLKATWGSVWKATSPPHNAQLEKVVEEEMEKEQLCGEGKEDVNQNSELVSPDMVGKLNAGRRVDYVLQEAPFEMINEYLFAMSSHVCYWESEDTMLLMLREIYDQIGVQPDSSVPQQSMSVQRTREVNDNTVFNETGPSTSRGGT